MTIYALSSSALPELYRYIGITIKPYNKRLIEHLSDSKRMKTHKDKWIQNELKMGNSILASEIDTAQSIPQMKLMEVEYIKIFKSLGAKLVNGTNGGDGSYGYKASKYSKDINSKMKSKIVFMFDSKTKKLIKKYNSTTEMILENKFKSSSVYDVLSGKASHYRGFIFSRNENKLPIFVKKEYDVWNKGISTIGKQRFKTSQIESITENGVLTFNTVNDCATYFGIHHSQICKAIKNRNGMYKKIKFKYVK